MDRHRHFNGGLHVIGLRLFAEVHIDWVSSTRNIKPGGTIEILLELLCIKSGGHDD